MTRIKVRIDNDFVFLWSIERSGVPEDLHTALEKKLYLHASNSRYEDVEIESYTVNGNILRIEFTSELVPHTGNYDFVFKYTLPDLSLSDSERKCAVDIEALTIVSKSSKADEITEIARTSDLLIGLKGDPFTYSDFTPEQLEALKVKGDPFTYSDFTPEQLEALKVKGDPFTYSDFTPEQLEALKVKGDPFTYSDFTPEQLEALKVKGDPFTYEDFTPEQLEALKVKGDKGDPLTYADLTEANKTDLRQPIYDDLLSLIYAGL